MTHRATAIIPARIGSSRLPGKVLEKIGREPMVWHVCKAAGAALGPDNVIVATDSVEVLRTIESLGGRACLTERPVDCGTARCEAAVTALGIDSDIIVNLQADEPFISPDDIRRLVSAFDDDRTRIATLARRFDPAEGWDTLFSPANPKVAIDDDGFALYFSRSIIPYVRDVDWRQWTSAATFHLHVGSYAFRTDVLHRVVSLKPNPLEEAERLEQLRWLAAGYRIKVVVTDAMTMSVDTPDDLEAARKHFNSLQHND